MSWVLVFLGFILLIVLHEAGHMIAAKKVGMRVERFFVFFPPKLFSIKRGETEYGIGAIPAGGFVKITGMNPQEDLEPEVAKRAYYRMPVWKRITVTAAGPAANLLVAFLILFALAFGAQDGTSLRVGEREADTPAKASLQHGDRIVAVDGVRARGLEIDDRAQRYSDILNRHRCAGGDVDGCRASTPVAFTIVREGKRKTLHLRPFYDADRDKYRLGFVFAAGGLEPANLSVVGAANLAVHQIWFVTEGTLSTVARIFEPEQREQLHGVVGISSAAHTAVENNARQALALLALISLALAIFNLFPFLPLDGGHIFWSLVEKARRGKPVPFRVMEMASAFGIMLVIAVAYIGLTNDLSGSGSLSGR